MSMIKKSFTLFVATGMNDSTVVTNNVGLTSKKFKLICAISVYCHCTPFKETYI